MTALSIGYRRVSTDDQSTDRQLDGITLDRCYDDHISGATRQRPQLDAMLQALRPGDTVHVHSIDRLARSLTDLQSIVSAVTSTGATLTFVKERLTFGGSGGDASALDTLLFHVLGAFAQFERSVIRSRSREGIERARAAGRYKGGTRKLSPDQVATLRALASATSIAAAARALGISRPTAYSYLRDAS